jgi:predicted DNA-binding transcriptional regulator YafY
MATMERYVTAGELARQMGVSLRTVRRMTAAGMPSETWGMGHTRRYLPSQAMAWASARATMAADHPPGRRVNANRANQRRK